METPPYQYQPLKHSDSIRVLILHPSPNESDPIECTIRRGSLSDDSFGYEAVSYTWGNSGLTNAIYCDEDKQRLSVGMNCHAALRRLRLPNMRRRLWLDAVCINQNDLQERAQQVCMMREIYDRAWGVRVMLSDEVPDSRLLLDELAEVEEILGHEDEVVRSPPSETIVRQLETMFQDPWFKRVWVLQEVIAAEDIELVYGSDHMSFAALRELYYGYHGTMVTRASWPRPLEIRSWPIEERINVQYTLWRQLYESRDCLATDPRDKVFALRSLLGSMQSEIDHLVDYTRSVEDCFKQVARFLLPVLGLRMLTATRHPHALDMASWIPDWSQTLPLYFNHFMFESDRAYLEQDVSLAANFEDHERMSQSYRIGFPVGSSLHVTGCRYARITECSDIFKFVDDDDAEKQMRNIYNHFPSLYSELEVKSRSDTAVTPVQFSQNIHDGKRRNTRVTFKINEIKAMCLMDGNDLHYNLTRDCGEEVTSPIPNSRRTSAQQLIRPK